MYFGLNQIPQRTLKPRATGLTMVMDKGLSAQQVENFLEISAPYVDVVKLGFGTAAVTPDLDKKLAIYRNHGIPYYFGGTLLEAFIIRNQLEDFKKLIDRYQLSMVEVSDGCMELDHQKKCEIISDLADKVIVLSEVGSKTEEFKLEDESWAEKMELELKAGSWKIIAEARESGTIGIFETTGEAKSDLIDKILNSIPGEKILWEAPQKAQQNWFIQLLGTNVNLGNIDPKEVIPLEALRVGLRGDTFDRFLD